VTRRDHLRRRLAALLALIVIAFAVSCTGTVQPGLPLALLVVEGGDATTASRVLGFAVDPPGPATPRAVRPLGLATLTPGVTGPIVDLDWLDRDETGTGAGRARSSVVLLESLRAPAAASRRARLHGYDTAGFDVAAPAPLAPVSALDIPLVSAGVFLLPPRSEFVQAPDPGVCLDAVSVSLTGRYVALLDRRSACAPGEDPTATFLLVVDTQERDLVWSSVADPVRAAAPIVDQGAGRVDFLRDARLWGLSLAAPAPVPLSGDVVATLDPVRGFVRHGADRLVLAGDAIRRIQPDGTVTPGGTTRPTALGFVETGAGLPVLVRTTGGLAVHASPADDDERFGAVLYADGTTDVVDLIGYLVRPGAIDAFDLLLYDATAGNPVAAVTTAYPAPDLQQPRVITFFRPRPALP
jgi:hypothetical protein